MSPVVRVTQGELRGVYCDNSQLDVKYVAFKGIPYAKPPLGNLRFRAPEPPEPWQGLRDASEHGPTCPQYNERLDRIDPGSEDCLYLNVYTRTVQPRLPSPVMVWIHGGGFYTGSGNSDFYGPEFFMKHDIVLVTINYRLEVLGFLCLENDEVPGNAGLKDQVAALKWIKNNIAAFGGNPDNVTIFGCSAGSASVSHHIISKMSEGLFNKAICQSGVCLNEWSYNIYPRERAFQLGKVLGLETEDPAVLLEFLRSIPVSSLVNVTLPPVQVKNYDLADSLNFGPVIEKTGSEVEKFLSEPPLDLIKKGEIKNVPMILGYTSAEGMEIARNLDKIVDFLSHIGAVVPRELKMKWSPGKIKYADEEIRKHYFKGKQITSDMTAEVVNFYNDSFFVYNIYRYSLYHSRLTTSPVYLYKFDADTERNHTKKRYNMDYLQGVCHSDDIMYQFNVTCLDVPLSEESMNIIENFVKLWTNFASDGNPTLSPTTAQWAPFTETELSYFIIGKEPKCIRSHDAENMKFWDEIYGDID